MRPYESPLCEVDLIVQEESFMATNTPTTETYPVNPSSPFGSGSMSPWEEDYDE